MAIFDTSDPDVNHELIIHMPANNKYPAHIFKPGEDGVISFEVTIIGEIIVRKKTQIRTYKGMPYIIYSRLNM